MTILRLDLADPILESASTHPRRWSRELRIAAASSLYRSGRLTLRAASRLAHLPPAALRARLLAAPGWGASRPWPTPAEDAEAAIARSADHGPDDAASAPGATPAEDWPWG
jgi:hypothetical protein